MSFRFPDTGLLLILLALFGYACGIQKDFVADGLQEWYDTPFEVWSRVTVENATRELAERLEYTTL
jgi:hypothetical protein